MGKMSKIYICIKKDLQITSGLAAINFILGLSNTSHNLEVTPDQ